MPDISGFTKFINETEIRHSSHIIQELLEIIINSNKLDLKLMEIEGDAVFFYRFGKMPLIEEIIDQAKIIFENFHRHLIQYETRRICQCGACRAASQLTLKFIVHAGLVGSYKIKNLYKLIGKDVIVLHRLLKNRIPETEYLLFTERFFENLDPCHLLPSNLTAMEGNEVFDEETVLYKYVPLRSWRTRIKREGMPSHDPDMMSVITVNTVINSSSKSVFNYMIDLSKRAHWMVGIKKTEIVSESKLNQTGTIHKCIIENNSVSFLRTMHFEHLENEYLLKEIEGDKGTYGKRFAVKSILPNKCSVQIEFLIGGNAFQKAVFFIFRKNEITRTLIQSVQNLKIRIEEPLA